MLRTHTCGELRSAHIGQSVALSGWAYRIRDKGGLLWIDLRDGYGSTQLYMEEGKTSPDILKKAREVGREFVLHAKGLVVERASKNKRVPTGDIEIKVSSLSVLSVSKTPPFTLENKSDGGEELRMRYRYLDLRRATLQQNLRQRHRLAQQVRRFLDQQGFLEIETPMLIKSTPEGARDFVVPSRLNRGSFYALPQSPQTFKQLLMVAGFDRYYQLVKCFRDEDFRADRQPEFTQIDCEMSFVEQDDVLRVFEKLVIHLFDHEKGVSLPAFPRMRYDDALKYYGSDKPDTRFDMRLVDLDDAVRGKGFAPFDQAETVVGLCAQRCAEYSRRQTDSLADFVYSPQVGGERAPVFVRYLKDGVFKSSLSKFYKNDELAGWAKKMDAKPGDLMILLAGSRQPTYKAMGALRLHLGNLLGLCEKDHYAPLWVVGFPLFEWDSKTGRFHAKHHPFTAPHPDDVGLLDSAPERVRANAYDMVINGVEVGGGSMRIYEQGLQQKVFEKLGFTRKEATQQFGFLLDAFRYGAPPHGGIAFGFDRLCALFADADSIRDCIAFPKNNAGRDLMLDSPSQIAPEQLDELGLKSTRPTGPTGRDPSQPPTAKKK